MVEQFANSGDPDQTPHSAASDPGLHCLPSTLLGVSRLQWVNSNTFDNKTWTITHSIPYSIPLCLCLDNDERPP